MIHQWNIYQERYHNFARKIRTCANRTIRKHIIYSENGDGSDREMFPRLIAKGTKMTRKMAYRLIRFYCNRHDVYYAGNDLDEIVDDIYGSEQNDLSRTLKVLDAQRHMNAVDSYQQELQQRYVERYIN